MPKTNKSKYAIMGMLSIRPMSGYDMKKLIAQSISYFWNESFGQIYPTLKKLVEEGLATRQTEKRLSK
ncbi:MAG: PadR family transcriptional regulator, partial [Gemmatimonadetes bacterium]|nr:PadR family transcriptional regulator [Gemmatimonadota bacterium]